MTRGFKYVLCLYSCRQYEERELQAQEDRAKKRMDFENQKMRLQNQLEFEKTKDTYGKATSIHTLRMQFKCADG